MAGPTLVWLHSSPYNSSRAREALDYLLALAAVEQPAQLLLTGPAVVLLQPHADFSQSLQLKDCSKQLGLLPLYELPAPWVCQHSLARYLPDAAVLAYDCSLLAEPDWQQQLSHFSQVVSF